MLNISNHHSTDSLADGDDDEMDVGLYNNRYDPEATVDKEAERNDILLKVKKQLTNLDIIEKKIIKLKGVDL